MIFYVIAFFSVIVFSSRIEFKNSSASNYVDLLFLAFFILLIIFGFRYGFGIDYHSYIGIFDRLGNNWSKENLEPGFYYLNVIIKALGGGPYVLIFVSFFLCLLFLHKAIKDNSDFPEISYLVFFSSGLIFFYTSGIRQAIALSMCFFSYKYIVEKSFWKFLAMVLLASSFHITALLFIPVYFFANLRYGRLFFIPLFLVSIVFIFIPNLILTVIEPMITQIYGDRFGNIISGALEIETQNTGLGLRIIFFNFLCVLVIYFYKELTFSQKGLLLTNFFIIGQLFSNVFGGIPDINRITLYFSIFEILFIPYTISLVKEPNIRATLYLFFFGTLSLFLIRNLQSDVYSVIPYRSIFN
ncbi:MAG: EpsG family protein [Anditalea sp.]